MNHIIGNMPFRVSEWVASPSGEAIGPVQWPQKLLRQIVEIVRRY
jgi:hypothetical protein